MALFYFIQFEVSILTDLVSFMRGSQACNQASLLIFNA